MSARPFLLDPQSLAAQVSAATYERGLAVLRNQQVLRCDLSGANSQDWTIAGLVNGSGREIYEVVVEVETSLDGRITSFNGDCSCPVSQDCKHSVALTLRAAYKSGGIRAASASAPASSPAAPAASLSVITKNSSAAQTLAAIEAQIAALVKSQKQKQEQESVDPRVKEAQQAQQRVTQWLDLFDAPAPGDTPAPVNPRSGQTAPVDCLIYLISAVQRGPHQVLQLAYGWSRQLRNGSWGKLMANRYNQPTAATGPDTEIVRLIEGMSPRSYYSAGQAQAVLAGATGLLALQLAAASGRLFAASDDRTPGPNLRLGPARTLHWRWSKAGGTRGKGNDTTQTASLADPLWSLLPRVADSGGVGEGAEVDAVAADNKIDSEVDTEVGSANLSGATTIATDLPCFHNSPPLYLDARAGLCGPVSMPGLSSEHLALLLNSPPIPQSAFAAHETTWLRRLAGLPLPPMMKAPEVMQGITPTARLHIAPVAEHERSQLGPLRATLRFDYGGHAFYAAHAQSPVLIEAEASTDPATATRKDGKSEKASESGGFDTTLKQRFMLHRDLPAEHSAQAVLRALGLTGNASGQFHLAAPAPGEQSAWLAWADDDFTPLREAGFTLSVEPSLHDWIARADALDVQMDSGHAGGDEADEARSPWFDLSLGMSINGERHNILPLLPALLAQLAARNPDAASNDGSSVDDPRPLALPTYVYLPQAGGKYLRLPTAPLAPWLQALLDLVGERGGQFGGDTLRLTRLEALRVGASLGEGAHWQGADSLKLMVQQLAGHSALPAVALPTGLMATLRPYQQQGLEWLQFLRTHDLAGILADDMGLGKTLQTLAHILVEKQAGRLTRPVLIIAPVSVIGNWQREASRFTPELTALVLHGSERHEAALEMARYDLIIAPYSLLQRDRERWLQQAWHLVVLDEAQNIKNANTHAAQVAGELNTRHRLCLSGTPMENHLGELWSLFHFLMPGFLSSQARFKALFRTPIERQGNSERLDQLRRRVTPFMLRRAKADVASDLPAKQVAISTVTLEGKQADLYETIRLTTEKAVREALASKGLAKSQIQVLDALLKLRQVCCDPRLVPLAAAKKVTQSAKLELLMEMLPELLAEGRRVLLFSQFTSMLSLIEEELVQRGIEWVKLTGQSQKRDALIERFTSGAVPLFLISLKAGGVGLNLTQADTVIHYDPWWNPAVENQATDRAHRIGQSKHVFVYKLVAAGTIEERMLALQERKAALADSLYSASAARKQPLFTEGDLAELLRPLGS